MAEGAITLPPGAFAAAKSGQPQPAVQPKAEAKAAPKEPVIIRKPAPSLREADPPKEEPKEAPKEMTATEKKIWKLKDGDEEFDFDASDEEAVKREVMKARAANKRFDQAAQEKREAAKLRGEAEQAFQMLRDPKTLRQILQDPRVGVDIKKMAEEIVWEQIQEQQLSPEQKAQRENERKLAEYEARDAKTKEEHQTKAQAEAQGRYEASYEQKIMKALDAGSIPKTPAAVSRMAEYLMKSVEHGYDLTPEDLVDQVRSDLTTDITSILGAASGEQLLALLGEANAEKLRKADLSRLKNPQGNPFPARSQQKKAADGKFVPNEKRKAGSEWREDLVKDFLNRNR